MDRMGTVTNPVKKGTTWLAEKASHVKFGGMASGNPALGTFLALETLALGVEGKICLWRSLKAIGKDHAVLASVNFDQHRAGRGAARCAGAPTHGVGRWGVAGRRRPRRTLRHDQLRRSIWSQPPGASVRPIASLSVSVERKPCGVFFAVPAIGALR